MPVVALRFRINNKCVGKDPVLRSQPASGMSGRQSLTFTNCALSLKVKGIPPGMHKMPGFGDPEGIGFLRVDVFEVIPQ